jgi:hypothetical protein
MVRCIFRQTSPSSSSVASTSSSLLDYLTFITPLRFQGQLKNVEEQLSSLESAAHHRRDRHSDFDKGSVHLGKLRRKPRKPKENKLGIKRGTMKARICNSDAVFKTMIAGCSCGKNCRVNFTAEQILKERNLLREKTIAEQNQLLTFITLSPGKSIQSSIVSHVYDFYCLTCRRVFIRYGSWIIDGMTQNTTALPKFQTKNKKWEKMQQNQRPHLATHLMGVLSAGEKPNAELSHKNISNDSNLVVDTLHRAIHRLQETRIRDGRPLPTVAYIQLDNVSSNKCSLVMAYGCWLVQQGIFDKVRFCYCLVGHTHENIDQFFSR